jgi:hypothetical protein
MSSLDAFALRRSGLDDFLFASVGTEPSGMTLSLLSVFARQGDDPWKEAGKLVSLPKGDAINSIAQAIARMPKSIWALPDATTIATRLVALLPSPLGNVQPKSSFERPRMAHLVGVGLLLAVVAFWVASTLGLFTSHHAPEFGGRGVSTLTSLPPPTPPID